MIKELGINEKTNWDEKVQIELSVADLQIIYDCVGAIPLNYLKVKHKNTHFECTAEILTAIYDELEEIVNKHNGITDNNKDVNLDIKLDELLRGDE